MNPQLIAAIIFLIAFCLLIVVTQTIHKVLHVQAEVSRKFMHVTGGVLSLFFPSFFTLHWWVLLLCSLAFFVLIITYIKKSLTGIHHTTRRSFGSVFFPIPVYVCFLAAAKLNNNILFYLPVMLLTVSDTVAELGGKKYGRYSRSFFNGQKTLAGSICFAVSSFLIAIILLAFIYQLSFIQALSISLCLTIVVTATELISLKGFDNITVPITALVLLILFLE